MGITERIEHDVAEAMRAKDEVRLSTLRLIRAAIKNQQIELRGKAGTPVSDNNGEDQLAISVIKRHVKQTVEAMEDYRRGAREDLVARAEQELKILQSYLPAELLDEEILKLIEEVIGESGKNGISNTGKLIGDVMKRIAGRADGGRVRTMIEARMKDG